MTVVVSIALVAGGVFVVAPPASAAPVWSITPSANLSQSELAGVSCPSPTSCFAVGNYTDGREKTLVEHWNGTSWTRMTSPNPGGHSAAGLVGVSCPTPTSCFGVGTYLSHGVGRTLVEHWNGSGWAIGSSPNVDPNAAFSASVLAGVSCASTTSCFAVGNHNQRAMIEHWNGRIWSIMNGVPSPSSTGDAPLYGVSCPGPKSCFAVGHFLNPRLQLTSALVEHWNGRGGWSIMSGVPNGLLYLYGVSCPGPKSCFAVGARASSPSLVEHWNGHGGWTFMTGAPPGLGGLAGVACAGPTDCVAVGGQAGGTPKSSALVEHWNGHGSWAAVTTPAPLQSGLVGVACPRAASCFAVGSRPGRSDSYRRTFVERSA